MNREQFAEHLGFSSYDALVGASEHFYTEGDIDWWITRLPDGRWAAWDDAELDEGRVAYFPTWEEAVEFQRAGMMARRE